MEGLLTWGQPCAARLKLNANQEWSGDTNDDASGWVHSKKLREKSLLPFMSSTFSSHNCNFSNVAGVLRMKYPHSLDPMSDVCISHYRSGIRLYGLLGENLQSGPWYGKWE